MNPETSLFGWQIVVAVITLCVVLGAIMIEKVNRTLVIAAAVILLIGIGVISFEGAFIQGVQWDAILLLVSMFIIASVWNQIGLLQAIAEPIIRLAKGSPVRLFVFISLASAVGAALLESITIAAVLVPLTLAAARRLMISPAPLLITIIMSANIGAMTTLIGSPINIMISNANSQLSFNKFWLTLAPLSLILLIVTLAGLLFLFRKALFVSRPYLNQTSLNTAAAQERDQSKLKAGIAIFILFLILLGFVVQPYIPIDRAYIALIGAGATLLLTVNNREWQSAVRYTHWDVILFIIGIYILVGVMGNLGMLNNLADKMLQITTGDITYTSMLVLGMSGLISATAHSIPFVAVIAPVLDNISGQLALADPDGFNAVWWCVVIGIGLGGNLTLIGTAANVMVAGIAAKEGVPISYMGYLKIAAPLTMLAFIIAIGYVSLFLV